MIDNIPDKITDKLPNLEQYSKKPGASVSYIFMLLFFVYFIYSEFIKEDDCGKRIVTLEQVLIQKDDMIDKLNKRVTDLEIALDVKNGVIRRVENKADSLSIGGML